MSCASTIRAVAPGAALFLLAASLLACFSFETSEGLECSETGGCPANQVCSAGVCLRPGNVVDFDAAAQVDAVQRDASPEGCSAGTLLCGEECLPACDTTLSLPGETSYGPEPGCATLRILAWGAGGGHGGNNLRAGAGGFASLDRPIAGGEQFTAVVGAPGSTATTGTGGQGGVPGGGAGGSGSSQGGGGGGGFSGLFSGPIDSANAILIAGGGGGSGGGGGNGSNTIAGAGGGLEDQSGRIEGTANPGGTQTTGFAPLQGQGGGNDSDGGGAGGGGWFGGRGGSGANSDAEGAGGGSGYVGDALVFELVTGVRGVAGNADSPLRGVAGDPNQPGKLVLRCLAADANQ